MARLFPLTGLGYDENLWDLLDEHGTTVGMIYRVQTGGNWDCWEITVGAIPGGPKLVTPAISWPQAMRIAEVLILGE